MLSLGPNVKNYNYVGYKLRTTIILNVNLSKAHCKMSCFLKQDLLIIVHPLS